MKTFFILLKSSTTYETLPEFQRSQQLLDQVGKYVARALASYGSPMAFEESTSLLWIVAVPAEDCERLAGLLLDQVPRLMDICLLMHATDWHSVNHLITSKL